MLDTLSQRFNDSNLPSQIGLDHVLRVEAILVDHINFSPHNAFVSPLMDEIRCAALLHDVGLTNQQETWCESPPEHIIDGVEFASEILWNIPPFNTDRTKISRILFLIKNHDNTLFSFPTVSKPGREITHEKIASKDITNLDIALALLKEADAIAHSDGALLGEMVKIWKAQGYPISLGTYSTLNSFNWMESIVNNLRILSRRCAIDAYSKKGEEQIRVIIPKIEALVEILCKEQGLYYEPELFTPTSLLSVKKKIASMKFKVQLTTCDSPVQLERILREIALRHDKKLLPYQNASIALKFLPKKQISPLAMYVIRKRLEETVELHDIMLATYGISIYDLPVRLGFRYNDDDVQYISPPVVEKFSDNSMTANAPINILVDGLHRCLCAFKEYSRIRCIELNNVEFPLIALPVAWDDVKILEQSPTKRSEKRKYRFSSIRDVPKQVTSRTNSLTKENLAYFFYRDLDPLGSKGERTFNEHDKYRAT